MLSTPAERVGLVMFILTIAIVLYFLNVALVNNAHHILSKNHPVPAALTLRFETERLVNCGNVPLPCITDEQCHQNCAWTNIDDIQACGPAGVCTTRTNVEAIESNVDCDATRGLIPVFLANEFAIQQSCISIYRDVIDDRGDLRPYICDGGSMSVDLVAGNFNPDDCTCPTGTRRLIFEQGALARPTPVCLPDRVVELYSRVYTG